VNGNAGSQAASQSGAAYVFTRDAGGSWSQVAYLKASNTQSSDGFGAQVALSSTTLAVSAPQEDSDAVIVNGDQNDNTASNAGAVYLFSLNAAGSWTQTAYVKAPNAEAGDVFGAAVAVSAGVLAVGVIGDDGDGSPYNNNVSDAGVVWVYR
jgi:hypothetical protein